MTYQPTRRSFIQLAGAATAGATLAGPLLAEAKDADTSALYAAAKKEGSITWWTAHYAQDAAEAVRDAFVKKYPGIQVSFIRQTAQVVFQRTLQDLKAGVKELDVFASTDEAHYTVLKGQGALASYRPPDIGALPKAFQTTDPDNDYQLGAIGFVVINYNTNKVKNPPKKWTDLLDPRWKNEITLGHPGFSGYVGNWVLAMNDKYGWDFFTKLAANNPKIGRSVNDTVTDIVAGERNVGAGPDNYSYDKKAQGNAIDVQFPEDDAIIIVSPVGIMKDAPHPNAARLFENFFYSKEYSQTMVKVFNFPLRTDVPAFNGMHLDKIKYYRNKVGRLATGVPQMIAQWRQTFGV